MIRTAISLLFFLGICHAEEWKIATSDHEFEFPRDHGSHPAYAIEWWYITGHLQAKNESDRRFGYQATFFRLGQRPGAPQTGETFDDSQIYMTHMAITELATGEFFHEERLNREGWDAYSRVGDLDVRNGNWTLKRTNEAPFEMQLSGSVKSDVAFDLTLSSEKPPVIFGENGVSRKGSDVASASLYITFTRLNAAGTVRLGDEEIEVVGQSWMDHEISSSQLDADQVGWDWTCIQLNDGREIMAYILRHENGDASSFSSCNWIDESGKDLIIQKQPTFQWKAGGIWESKTSGGKWPIGPTIETIDPTTGEAISLTLRPLQENQEMQGHLTGVTYWEGACDVYDSDGEQVGKAYLELTGYAGGQLKERLRPMDLKSSEDPTN